MSEPQLSFQFRRPTPVVKATLVIYVASFLIVAIGVHISDTVSSVARQLILVPHSALERPWTLVTHVLVPNLDSPWISITDCMMLYFFGPDLEDRWGGAKLVAFMAVATAGGGLLAVGLAGLHLAVPPALGASALCSGLVVAWGLMNAERQFYFFFISLKGIHLVWITVAFEVLGALTSAGLGVVPAFGGILVGAIWASFYAGPIRKLVLQRRLKKLEAERDAVVAGARRKASAAASGLRVIPGGKDDDGKRWMN